MCAVPIMMHDAASLITVYNMKGTLVRCMYSMHCKS